MYTFATESLTEQCRPTDKKFSLIFINERCNYVLIKTNRICILYYFLKNNVFIEQQRI